MKAVCEVLIMLNFVIMKVMKSLEKSTLLEKMDLKVKKIIINYKLAMVS